LLTILARRVLVEFLDQKFGGNKIKTAIKNYQDKKLNSQNIRNTDPLKLMIYIFLQMISKKYVESNLNKYSKISLLFCYKQMMGKDYSIINSLIDNNINLLLSGPMLSDIGSMFMSIDELEKYKHKNSNDKLINFIIFIMRKYVSSKKYY